LLAPVVTRNVSTATDVAAAAVRRLALPGEETNLAIAAVDAVAAAVTATATVSA